MGDWDLHIHTTIYKLGNKYSVMTYMGKECKRVDVRICITDSLCCIPETNTTLEINCRSIKVKKKESTIG